MGGFISFCVAFLGLFPSLPHSIYVCEWAQHSIQTWVFGDGDSHVSSLSDYQMPVPLGRREVHRIAKRDARQ